MLNFIWLALILAAVGIGGATGRLKEVSDGAIRGAETSVTLAIGLVGVMALWLGMMRLAERAGLVGLVARALRPLLRRLFPDVPPDHPAMGAMVMNIAANMLGLTNAATPLGLRAMRDLASLNPVRGSASNAMCTFLAINTGSVQLIPITAIAVLASAGASNPSAIIGTALLATCCSSAVGLAVVKWLETWKIFRVSSGESTQQDSRPVEELPNPIPPTPLRPWTPWRRMAIASFLGASLLLLAIQAWQGSSTQPGAPASSLWVALIQGASLMAIPFLLGFFPLYAALRGVLVYEEFVEGAKEGFQVAVRIIPYLVAMLVAIMMFREAGGIDMLTHAFRPLLELLGFPPELLPMALMRPLSGSGSLAIFTDLVKTLGPNHLIVQMAGTIFGSTETTFYVIAVYFGAVGVQRTRHAIPAGLAADMAGVAASIAVCRWILG